MRCADTPLELAELTIELTIDGLIQILHRFAVVSRSCEQSGWHGWGESGCGSGQGILGG